jgi:kynureninase
MKYREDAFRFLLGTPAVPPLYTAREGPRIVRQAGAAPIREKSLRQTTRAVALAEKRGFRLATPADPSRRGGTASIDVPHALEVSRELNARDVVVDYRPGVGIRLSPHFYTEDAEIDRAFAVIDEILETGAWKRWTGPGSLVT